MPITIEDIAKQVYYTNKAWCEANGDFSFTSWEEAPDWQKATNIKGIEFLIANPSASPSDSHESWMREKTEQGWTYGEVKDPIAKTHPAYLPYDELPEYQRIKDYLFRSVVEAMLPFLEDKRVYKNFLLKKFRGGIKYFDRELIPRETITVSEEDVGSLDSILKTRAVE